MGVLKAVRKSKKQDKTLDLSAAMEASNDGEDEAVVEAAPEKRAAKKKLAPSDEEEAPPAKKQKPSACSRCKEEGHFPAKCPQKKCFNCNELGHKTKDCTTPCTATCFNCKEVGHKSVNCTQTRKPKQKKKKGFNMKTKGSKPQTTRVGGTGLNKKISFE